MAIFFFQSGFCDNMPTNMSVDVVASEKRLRAQPWAMGFAHTVRTRIHRSRCDPFESVVE